LGKSVKYESLELDKFESRLRHSGVSDLYIAMFTMWAKAEKGGAMDVVDLTLAKLLGRNPVTMSQFIGRLY
jgi:NAD(P)H dehydrogenase (quinone)